MPVMEGKALLFKAFGGVDAFPICLNTQDPEQIIQAVRWLAPTFGGVRGGHPKRRTEACPSGGMMGILGA